MTPSGRVEVLSVATVRSSTRYAVIAQDSIAYRATISGRHRTISLRSAGIQSRISRPARIGRLIEYPSSSARENTVKHTGDPFTRCTAVPRIRKDPCGHVGTRSNKSICGTAANKEIPEQLHRGLAVLDRTPGSSRQEGWGTSHLKVDQRLILRKRRCTGWFEILLSLSQ